MTRLLLLALLAAAQANAVTFRELESGPAPRESVYRHEGTQALRVFWFTPPDWTPSDKRPALLWIHGGAWVGGTLDGFMPHARYFASRGLVTFNVEYRLAKPDGPTMRDCVSDCAAALAYVRQHAAEFGVDPARVTVAGDSAGGHLAAALGVLPDSGAPPDARLLFNPVLDLTEGDWVRYAVGGPALADKTSQRPTAPAALERARELSPLFHVRAGQPPALLMHGRDDTVVPLAQAERFDAASRAAGNRCEFLVLEKAGHAFVVAHWKSPEPVVVDTVRTADRFLASLNHLTGEPTLVPSTEPAWQPKGKSTP
jgi:acetyl esterase/lipase